MARRQDDHIRLTVRIPRDIYERIAGLPGEGSINAKIVNALDAAALAETLRDRFAMAALPALLTEMYTHSVRRDIAVDVFGCATVAAYQMADAMLAERDK
jgi:hypothetical protein